MTSGRRPLGSFDRRSDESALKVKNSTSSEANRRELEQRHTRFYPMRRNDNSSVPLVLKTDKSTITLDDGIANGNNTDLYRVGKAIADTIDKDVLALAKGLGVQLNATLDIHVGLVPTNASDSATQGSGSNPRLDIYVAKNDSQIAPALAATEVAKILMGPIGGWSSTDADAYALACMLAQRVHSTLKPTLDVLVNQWFTVGYGCNSMGYTDADATSDGVGGDLVYIDWANKTKGFPLEGIARAKGTTLVERISTVANNDSKNSTGVDYPDFMADLASGNYNKTNGTFAGVIEPFINGTQLYYNGTQIGNDTSSCIPPYPTPPDYRARNIGVSILGTVALLALFATACCCCCRRRPNPTQ